MADAAAGAGSGGQETFLDDGLARAALLGVVSGLRSQVPLAVLAFAAADRPEPDAPPTPAFLRADWARPVFGLLAAGEMVGDKLPFAPSRLNPGPLAGRIVIGAAAGAIVGRQANETVLSGALLGGIGALVGSVAGNRFRVLVGRHTPLPDPVLAVAEDALAVTLGSAAVRAQPIGE